MSKMKSYRKTATLFAATAVIAVGSALAFQHYTNASAQPAETPPAVMPATPVSVKTVSPDDVMIWSEFSGRMNAVDFAEIRPQVSGRITQVRFADGQSVKAGAVLFVIDPRPFEAALAKAAGEPGHGPHQRGFRQHRVRTRRGLDQVAGHRAALL